MPRTREDALQLHCDRGYPCSDDTSLVTVGAATLDVIRSGETGVADSTSDCRDLPIHRRGCQQQVAAIQGAGQAHSDHSIKASRAAHVYRSAYPSIRLV